MGKVAYTLREEFAGTVTQVLEVDADGEPTETQEVPAYSGGLINAGPFDLNIGEELENGKGTIVVDDVDPRVTSALDEYPALKRTEVPDNADVTVGWDSRNAQELKDELTRRGVSGHGNAPKAKLVEALETLDAHPLSPSEDGQASTATLVEVLEGNYTGAAAEEA